jgi:hypothetical protein
MTTRGFIEMLKLHFQPGSQLYSDYKTGVKLIEKWIKEGHIKGDYIEFDAALMRYIGCK